MKYSIKILQERLDKLDGLYNKFVVNGSVNKDSWSAEKNRNEAEDLRNAIQVLNNGLIKEIEKYGGKYQISFQFWGDGNNNVFIMKDDVDLYSSGGFLSIQGALMDALQYIYKINRVPYEKRVC